MIEDNDKKYFTLQSNIVFTLILWYFFEIINNDHHFSLEQMEIRQSVESAYLMYLCMQFPVFITHVFRL